MGSNETMTDVIAELELIQRLGGLGHTTHARIDNCIARLRGEAAQTFMGIPVVVDESMPADAIRVVAAAPTPVAGDAVAKVLAHMRKQASDLEGGGGCEDAWAHHQKKFADQIEAALAQDRASQGAAAGVPEDFITHREAWRDGLNRAVRYAKDSDDASYWMHEVRAFDRAYAQLLADAE